MSSGIFKGINDLDDVRLVLLRNEAEDLGWSQQIFQESASQKYLGIHQLI